MSDTEKPPEKRRRWLTTRQKFIISVILSLIWMYIITLINLPWIDKLAFHVPYYAAAIAISLIAIIPSFWYMFVLVACLIDTRPEHKPLESYPDVSLLIAAFNEEENIADTVMSLSKITYPGNFEIIFIDDGSTDRTVEVLKEHQLPHMIILEPGHQGKAGALNAGLMVAKSDLIVTIDADTYLLVDSITLIVEHIQSSLPDTAAIAGSVCVRNSRENLLTKIQEWNYFNEFISQKRIQSLYQGTLVAQGAFSVYRKKAVLDAGGWPHSVGEDIVLTWGLLKKGYRIGFCEVAFAFTNTPVTYKKLFLQRSRWSQGMIEALLSHTSLLLRFRMTTLFIWWNLLIPFIDLAYGLIFIPGVIAAFFGYYYIAGPMTVSVIPLILINNTIFFWKNRKEFKKRKLSVRKNILGYFVFLFFYQALIMVPSAIYGYATFLLHKRRWGTK